MEFDVRVMIIGIRLSSMLAVIISNYLLSHHKSF